MLLLLQLLPLLQQYVIILRVSERVREKERKMDCERGCVCVSECKSVSAKEKKD